MLSQVWSIAALYLRQTAGNRSTFIQLLLVPLILTFILGNALAPSSGSRQLTVPIGVVNADQGLLGTSLVTALEANPILLVQTTSAAAAAASLNDRDTVATLVIPADFTSALLNRQSTQLEYQITASNPDNQFAQQTINTIIAQLAASLQSADASLTVIDGLKLANVDAAAKDKTWNAVFTRAMDQWSQLPPITVTREQVTRIETNKVAGAQGFNQSSPGLLVMFGLLFMVGGGATLVQEREVGTLQRLLVAPLRKSTILLGKIMGVFTSGLLQMGILIGVAALAFGVKWGDQPLAILLLVVCFALMASSLGLMMAALSRTPAQLGALSTVIVLTMSALGGAWWPLEIVPSAMQKIGHLFPTAWAMDGFSNIITRGLGPNEIMIDCAALLGFAALFFVIGVWRFRFVK
jgi:ABC-2 type transport system permease protein